MITQSSERTVLCDQIAELSFEIDQMERRKLNFFENYNKYARKGIKMHPNGENRLKAFDRLIKIMKGRFQRILRTLNKY